MLWLSFIPELNNIFLCFKFIVRHYYGQKAESVNQDKIKLKPHNIKLILKSKEHYNFTTLMFLSNP